MRFLIGLSLPPPPTNSALDPQAIAASQFFGFLVGFLFGFL